jgi:hypothetical protein
VKIENLGLTIQSYRIERKESSSIHSSNISDYSKEGDSNFSRTPKDPKDMLKNEEEESEDDD